MKNKHNIDELFKAGLEHPDIPFNEKDWEDMAKRLDAAKKKRVVPMWWLAATGVAAALLIFLFTILFEQQPLIKKPINLNARNSNSATQQKKTDVHKSAENVLNSSTQNGLSSQRNILIDKPKKQPIPPTLTARPLLPNALSSSPAFAQGQADTARFIAMTIHEAPSVAGTPQYTKVKHRPFSFSIMAAPDISSTGTDLSSKVSTNIGLLVNYPVTNRISISTGLIYARKLYNSGAVNTLSYGYGNNSWQMNADCSVLDIPINMNYQVFKKQRFSVSINTGLSSYLMLNERYQFKNGTEGAITTVEVRNKNRHPFSVANLSVGLERKINSSLSIGLEPFIKLPLTGVGDYDARLKSTGIAVSLRFDILGRKQ
jgi:hypothetical protein